MLLKTEGTTGWLGINDLKEEGTWVNPEGTALKFSKWHGAGVPKNNHNDCGMLVSTITKTWMDTSCSGNVLPFICQFQTSGTRTPCQRGKEIN